jgi:hypothetical protein
MRTRRVFVLSAVWISCGMALEAQTGLPPQPFEAARSKGAFTATLVSTDATHLVAQADDGSVVTFVVDGTSAIPPGLVSGSRVTVRYELAEGGSRYRVASVGIPKVPLEGGSTTEPPPSPEAGEAEPAPGVDAEAALESPGSGMQGDLEGAAPGTGPPAGTTGKDAPASPVASSPGASPSPDGKLAKASMPTPSTDGSIEGLQPGREAFLIGGGLLLVASALGGLVFLRR